MTLLIISRRLLRSTLALLCLGLWATARAETPAAGAGGPANPTPSGTAKPAASCFNGKELPWPEPGAKEVEKLTSELRAQLPKETFCVLRVGPWIIATDLDEASAKHFAGSTIAIYAAQIQKQLFTGTPRREPVKVYLFKDHESYTKWNVKLFGERPSTPYGYYSRARKALVMNIGTGGGTLLHEMAHAMAEADFEAIPAWLNEGLGSLFEASGMDPNRKRVVGLTNWRLTGLQDDLKKNKAVRFAALLDMEDGTFYGADSGSNYASARYLMQYLQEQGKLEDFYTRIRDRKDEHPAAALRAVFENRFTVEEIEKACYAWVLTLRFR